MNLEKGVELLPGVPSHAVRKPGKPLSVYLWGSPPPEAEKVAVKFDVPPAILKRILYGTAKPSVQVGRALEAEGIVIPFFSADWLAREWRAQFIEDIYRLAERVGESPSYITSILDRQTVPSFELAVRLESSTKVHRDIWLRPDLHTDHPVFFHFSDNSRLTEPTPTSKEAAELWGKGGFSLVALETGIPLKLVVMVAYRRLDVKVDLAVKLQEETGVCYVEFLRSRVSTHPAFIGNPEDAK